MLSCMKIELLDEMLPVEQLRILNGNSEHGTLNNVEKKQQTIVLTNGGIDWVDNFRNWLVD